MYKAIFSIFLAALVVLLISTHLTYAAMPAPRPHKAAQGPLPAQIVHDGGTLLTSSLADKTVTWTVWNSNDAEARVRNATLAAAARRDPNVVHIGINTDPSARLHHALLQRDGLAGDPYQLHVSR